MCNNLILKNLNKKIFNNHWYLRKNLKQIFYFLLLDVIADLIVFYLNQFLYN